MAETIDINLEKMQLAVLIDADNISSKYAATIFEELENYGLSTYRRIYGNWSKGNGWTEGILLEHSFQMAAKLGYPAIVIFGNPDNYIGRGFQSCRKYRVRTEEGGYPAAMLVKELTSGILAGRSWVYHESAAYRYDSGAAEAFDRQFEPKEKAWRPSQEMFYILSHSSVSDESIE